MAANGNARGAVAAAPGVKGTLQNKPAHFTTICPRQARALAALMRGPLSREEIDRLAGAANGPDLVAQLRRRGFAISCVKVRSIDRDGRTCWPGVYSLTDADRVAASRWLAGGSHG